MKEKRYVRNTGAVVRSAGYSGYTGPGILVNTSRKGGIMKW